MISINQEGRERFFVNTKKDKKDTKKHEVHEGLMVGLSTQCGACGVQICIDDITASTPVPHYGKWYCASCGEVRFAAIEVVQPSRGVPCLVRSALEELKSVLCPKLESTDSREKNASGNGHEEEVERLLCRYASELTATAEKGPFSSEVVPLHRILTEIVDAKASYDLEKSQIPRAGRPEPNWSDELLRRAAASGDVYWWACRRYLESLRRQS